MMVIINFPHLEGVRVLDLKENKGKAMALFEGAKITKGDIIITLDSDTFLEKGAIEKLVEKINENVGVAGFIKVRDGLWSSIVTIEYWWGQLFLRVGQGNFGSVLITPGCFSAYDRELFIKILSSDSRKYLSEDFFISFLSLRDGEISFAKEAVAETNSPKNLEGLVKQRLRWHRGFLQVIFRNAPKFKKKITLLEYFLTVLICSQLAVILEVLFLTVVSYFFGLGSIFLWFLLNHIFVGLHVFITDIKFKTLGKEILKKYLLLPFYLIFLKAIALYSLFSWKKIDWGTR